MNSAFSHGHDSATGTRSKQDYPFVTARRILGWTVVGTAGTYLAGMVAGAQRLRLRASGRPVTVQCSASLRSVGVELTRGLRAEKGLAKGSEQSDIG